MICSSKNDWNIYQGNWTFNQTNNGIDDCELTNVSSSVYTRD